MVSPIMKKVITCFRGLHIAETAVTKAGTEIKIFEQAAGYEKIVKKANGDKYRAFFDLDNELIKLSAWNSRGRYIMSGKTVFAEIDGIDGVISFERVNNLKGFHGTRDERSRRMLEKKLTDYIIKQKGKDNPNKLFHDLIYNEDLFQTSSEGHFTWQGRFEPAVFDSLKPWNFEGFNVEELQRIIYS